VQLPVVQATPVVFDGSGFVQSLPHVPQFCVLVAVLVSQPSVCLFALQSPHPLAHVPLHVPLKQLAVTWLVEHGTLHAPQFDSSVAVLISHPSMSLSPLQSAYPLAHAPLQTPIVQAGVTWLLLHTFPQPPQLATLDAVSTSQPFVSLSPSQSQ